MDSTTQRWVAALKRAFPHLPEHLSPDVERANLRRLERWFASVEAYRKRYDQMQHGDLPEELQNETGKRQIIPVLLSLPEMTEDEIAAWHELFVCLSAHMAELAYGYWRTHSAYQSAVDLEDALNYLPVVFLYVLSSYKEYPGSAGGSFAHSQDGRVRLITWVHIESRRHINTYLQQHAYTVKQGSGYMHRLRQNLLKVQQDVFAREGAYPTHERLVEELSRTHYGSLVTSSTLSGHITDLLSSEPPVSLSDAYAPARSDAGLTYSDTLASSDAEIESLYNPFAYVEERVRYHTTLSSACAKLLYTSSPLTPDERFYLHI